MRHGQRCDVTQEAIDRLRDFLASRDATPPSSLQPTPESTNDFRKASDFGFDLIDARERRLSLVRQSFPARLWLAIAAMSFALALVAFLVLAAPVPAVMLFVYSNPIANGLIDIAASLDAVP